MKERPILFSAPMVQAILAGNKTQTRRVCKDQPHESNDMVWWPDGKGTDTGTFGAAPGIYLDRCPYGQIGDQLWVRETWRPLMIIDGPCSGNSCVEYLDGGQKYKDGAYYDQSNHARRFDPTKHKWKPSIHMPRWASRIQLEITNIRVERLQDISESDALAEGCRPIEGCKWHTWEEADAGIPMHDHTARDAFSGLWAAINGEDSWTANPWIWVIEFKRVERPA